MHSFVELTKQLLDEGFEFVLSDRFNQDPLEEHFGKQRMRGGGLDNPMQIGYGQNENKIILSSSANLTVMRGNTRGRKRDDQHINIHDERQLPKRKKKKKISEYISKTIN